MSIKSIKSKLSLAQGKQNLVGTCSKGKLEFKSFSSPELEKIENSFLQATL